VGEEEKKTVQIISNIFMHAHMKEGKKKTEMAHLKVKTD